MIKQNKINYDKKPVLNTTEFMFITLFMGAGIASLTYPLYAGKLDINLAYKGKPLEVGIFEEMDYEQPVVRENTNSKTLKLTR